MSLQCGIIGPPKAGKPAFQGMEPADCALADAGPSQRARIAEALEKVAQYAPQLALGEYSTLMNDLHRDP